jgi:hypothetical protein
MVVLVIDVPSNSVAAAIAALASSQQCKQGPDQTRGGPWSSPHSLAAASGCTTLAGLLEFADLHPDGSLDQRLKGLRFVSPSAPPAAHLKAPFHAAPKGSSPLDRYRVNQNEASLAILLDP